LEEPGCPKDRWGSEGQDRGDGLRGITVAEWLLELELTAVLCLAGAPFGLSVEAEHYEVSL
jgi:hypothetical protein